MIATSSSTKAVLFDFDDTLFDHLHSTRQGLQAVCAAYPILQLHSIDVLFADYTRLLDEVHLHVLEGRLTIDQARRERFRRFFQLHAPTTTDLPTVIEHAATLHRERYQASRQTVAGVVPLLEHLHKLVKIAIVTNNLRDEQLEKLHYLQLEHLIDELVTSEETGLIKPDPGIFHIALERLGFRAEEAVVVGDSWHGDVLGAHQAGCRAVWLNRRGVACPDRTLATELLALEPLAEVAGLILADG